ncbi:MAG: YceI family protein [bacterium]
MRLNITHAFAAVLVLTPIRVPGELLVPQPESRIWVEGTSTIKSFKCSVTDFALIVNGDAGAVPAVLDGKKAVKSVALSLPAAKIDCANGTMNDHMRNALKVETAPTIQFTLSGYDVAKAATGVEGVVRGTLSLGGAEHPVDVTAVATDAGNGALRVAGGYELALSAFDLKAPSLMFGRIKVGDKVQVKFDLILKN